MKVLVIDDDPAVADGLREALAERRLAPELSVAESAVEALRRLRQEPDGIAVVLANPADWPGRLGAAVAELKAATPQANLIALLEPRGLLAREDAVEAGFDDAFFKHARVYPVLGCLVAELGERMALTRQQLRLSQGRSDAELLLTAVMTASDAAVAILDGHGAVTVANGQFGRLVDRPLADILQAPVWPLLQAASATALRSVLEDRALRAGAVGFGATLLDRRGIEVAANARLAVRELNDGQRSAVLCLRPVVAGSLPDLPATRAGEPLADAPPETLRAMLRLRRTPPVVARIRPADGSRSLARAGSLPPEVGLVLRLALRSALSHLLTNGDLLFGGAEDVYVLLSDESTLEAMRRLGRTIPAVRDALLVSAELAHDLLSLGGARLVEQRDRLCELQVVAATVDILPEDLGHEELPTVLATRLQGEEAALGADTLRSLNELRMHATCELVMVQDQDGAPSALCLPCLDDMAAIRFGVLHERSAKRPELALQLALLQLELTVEALEREVDRDSALAVVDLQFGVLGHRRLADRFLDRCRALPPELARTLVVNLLGVPPGAYAPKFARVTSALQEIFRLRALTMRDIRADLVDLDLARIGLIIVDYRDLEPLLDSRQDLVQALVRKAHRSQARLLVRRAPRGIAAELRERLGIDLTSSA